MFKQMFDYGNNKEIREWFISSYTDEQKSFLYKNYNKFISIYQIEMDFFVFLKYYFELKGLKVPEFKRPQLNNVEKINEPQLNVVKKISQ